MPGTCDTGFVTALFGDLVWRLHAEDVPDAIGASVGLSQQAGPLVLTLGLRHLESLDGPGILGPGFTSLDSFPAVKEVNTALDFGLGFTLGRISLGLGCAQTVQGRNTPKKSVFSLGASRSF